jgi:hypothetical protein
MIHKALFLTCSTTDFSGSGLLYDKELIYVGEFVKGDVEFSVTEELIDHWVTEFQKMATQGFKAKLPVEHTFDPEKNRGHVVALSKKVDSKGRIALFGKLEFVDADAAKLARSTDVSIYAPPSYTMGNGYTANRPITHVALTDYPVVPGLDPFETLAASLFEESSMNIKDLADKLGITVPAEVTDEAAIVELIVSEVEKMRKATETKPADPAPVAASADPAIAASMAALMFDARVAKIDGLVAACKLTPAEATSWKASYAKKEALSLSNNDGFDVAFSLAQARQPFTVVGEKTRQQSNLDPAANPLLKDAMRRKG